MKAAKQLSILGSSVHFWVFNPQQQRTIVMIHGFRGTHHGLQNIIDRLPEYRIIIPDLPGFGDSTPMNQPHTVAGYAAFISQFIAKLGLQRPVLLGHSFGSIVAAHIAAHQPKFISKLILINPIADNPDSGSRKFTTQGIKVYYWLGHHLPKKLGEGLLRSRLIVLGSSKVMTKTHDETLQKKIHAAHLRHFSSFSDRRILHEVFKTSISANVMRYAPKITLPTLLIAGSIDDIAPLSSQYALRQQLPHSTLVVIDNVGHLIHHEAPAEAAAAIKKFLN